eukprot:CAMPEP_0196584044 /NCGR_PEP_ID=MMETSP1081-20130531/45556_1 /TAXON_ID=36882 /ORGANISM="Pyramimonas amylifera, Strain CCMP720" /LENGTH=69 /DNA_ID=CAMNT_0041905121 /DNA_START=32 /DNA_END=237 /DNA_ORIENTATION=+
MVCSSRTLAQELESVHLSCQAGTIIGALHGCALPHCQLMLQGARVQLQRAALLGEALHFSLCASSTSPL